MSTRPVISIVGRILVGGACLLTSVSCGSEMLRTGRSPVYLVVERIEATPGGPSATASAFLQSDVDPVFNDSVLASIRVLQKNPTVPATDINSVTLTRYHVEYRRTDGRNTPGADVPYAFDGGLSVTIAPDSVEDAILILVRNQAKIEPPLRNLKGLGGQIIISAIAEITFYGHDQNGNEISVVAHVDVHFADYADAA